MSMYILNCLALERVADILARVLDLLADLLGRAFDPLGLAAGLQVGITGGPAGVLPNFALDIR